MRSGTPKMDADRAKIREREGGVPFMDKGRQMDAILINVLEEMCRRYGRNSAEARRQRMLLGISEPYGKERNE